MNTPQKTKQITVFVGLVIKDEMILMVQRNEPEVDGAHLKWEFPGGKVDFGETPEEAVVREFKEETGVTVKIKRLLPTVQTTYWDYPWGVQHTLLFAFECEFVKEEERENDHHVASIKWVPISEFYDYESLPGGREFFECLRG